MASGGPPAPYVDSPASIPATFQVVTSSPAARIDVGAQSLVLVDGDAGRSLKIDMNDPVFDGRYAQASDAHGRVEVRVTPVRCQLQGNTDDYPYTARAVIDDGPAITGCGKPLP